MAAPDALSAILQELCMYTLMVILCVLYVTQHIVVTVVYSYALAGDELHKAPDVDREEATRRKAENTRRQALNIAPANFRPRPELGTDEVALQIVKSTLDKATTDASCKRAIGTSKHMCCETRVYTPSGIVSIHSIPTSMHPLCHAIAESVHNRCFCSLHCLFVMHLSILG